MPELNKGETVEGYRVLDLLGRGAASVVYLVQDPKTKQVWALKHVQRREEDKDSRFLDQAEQEFKVGSKVHHRNVRHLERMIKKTRRLIHVTDVFLVMEFLDGKSLDTHPPRSFVQATDIFHQAALGLAHMHECGFIHADMKPNNIVVEPDGVVKLIDLGQSCEAGTVKPRIQGTPDYIAPEQVHRRPITPKTDIYNLGATMYAICTGQNVPTALAKGDKLVGSLDDNLIEKPKAAIELNPKINPKLNELIMQCVEVNPDKRPASMHAVADRLNLIHALLIAENNRKTGEFRPLDSQAD